MASKEALRRPHELHGLASGEREPCRNSTVLPTTLMVSLVLHGFILTLYVKKRGIWKEKMYLRQENEIKLVVTSINQQSTEQPVGMGNTSAL